MREKYRKRGREKEGDTRIRRKQKIVKEREETSFESDLSEGS